MVSTATLCGPLQVPYSVLIDGTARECWSWPVSTTHEDQSQMYIVGKRVVALHEVDADVANLQLALRYHSNGNFTFAVGVAEDPEDTSTIVWMHTVRGPRNSSCDTVLSFSSYTGNGRHFAMKTLSFPMFIDSIGLDYISCYPVDSLWLSDLQGHSAVVEWNGTNNTEEYLVMLSHGQETDTMLTTEPFVTFDGLTPTTDYSVRVLAVCSAGDTSLPSPTFTFHTLCVDAELPMEINFSGMNAIPECWHKVIYTTVFPCVSSNLLALSNSSTTRTMIATPRINAPGNQLHVSFKATADRTTVLEAGVMSDLDDTSTFIPIYVKPIQRLSSTVIEFNTDTVAACSESEHYYVAFRAKGYAVIFSININDLASCRATLGGSVSDIRIHRLTAQWQPADADSYLVTCTGGGDTVSVLADSTCTAIVDGLQGGTNYNVSVTSICGGTMGETRVIATAKTVCDIHSLPYSDNFQSTGNEKTPSCWQYTQNNNVGVAWVINYFWGGRCLLVSGVWAHSPRFVVPEEGLQYTFVTGYEVDNSTLVYGVVRIHNDSIPDLWEWFDNYTMQMVSPNSDGQFATHTLQEHVKDTLTFYADSMNPGDTVAVVFAARTMPQQAQIFSLTVDTMGSLPPQPDTLWHNVTVESANTSMGTVSGSGVYADSSLVTISATPVASTVAGYHHEFVNWQDGDTTNPRQIIVTCDTSFIAFFRMVDDGVGFSDIAVDGTSVYLQGDQLIVTSEEGEKLQVFDVMGRQVFSCRTGDNATTVSTQGLAAGVYIVKIASQNGTSVRRFILR